MKKSSLRSFGIAFFLIGAILLLNDKFGTTESETINLTEYEQKIADLEYQLAEANEQIVLLEKAQQTVQTKDESTDTIDLKSPPERNEVDSSKEVVQAILHVYSGLTAYDIGKKLEDLGIVKNGLEMELYLAKPEFAKSIQIGHFELKSSMSIEEIANTLTGKKSTE